MAIDSVTRDLFERIAKMEAMGVANGDIAKATGLSDGRISQVQAEPEYQELLVAASAENLERNMLINQGWDSVEEQALATVVTHLTSAPDPDYALKAAALANKAQRKNAGNKSLNPGSGNYAVINLNATFVEKVNGMFSIGKDGNEGENVSISGENSENSQRQLPQKDSNFLPPNAVEKLLGAAQSKMNLKEVNPNELESELKNDFSNELEDGINGILEPAPL